MYTHNYTTCAAYQSIIMLRYVEDLLLADCSPSEMQKALGSHNLSEHVRTTDSYSGPTDSSSFPSPGCQCGTIGPVWKQFPPAIHLRFHSGHMGPLFGPYHSSKSSKI